MIYIGLNRTGEIETVKAHGGADVAEVYGGINESNPIYYKSRTLTGTSPLSYKALSKPLSDYLISGNTVQDGTPVPDAPVDVVGCGERTENLFDYLTMANGSIGYLKNDGTINLAESWEITKYIPVSGKSFTLVFDGINATPSMCAYDLSKNFITGVSYNNNSIVHISSESNIAYIRFSYKSASHPDPTSLSILMLNTGTTAKPYEPYGFKLPITVNGTEYPIYLGQVPTTRRIKKLVLTGDENWLANQNTKVFYCDISQALLVDDVLTSACTHYVASKNKSNYAYLSDNSCCIRWNMSTLWIRDTARSDVDAFKSYLQQQYSSDTPVSVWYVLAEPETGTVNEPLHKISTYADTISMEQAGVTIPTVAGTNTLLVDTTVQPSEVSITGNIKEVST